MFSGRTHVGYYAIFRNKTVRVVSGSHVKCKQHYTEGSTAPATPTRSGTPRRPTPLFRSVFPKSKEKSPKPPLFTKDSKKPPTAQPSPYPATYPNLPILPPSILDFCIATDDDFGDIDEHPRPVLHGCYERGGDWAKSTATASHTPSTSGVMTVSTEDPHEQFCIRIYAGGRPITKLTSLATVFGGVKQRASVIGREEVTASQSKLGSTGSLLDARAPSARPSSSRITFAKEPTVSVIGVDTICSTPFERLNQISERDGGETKASTSSVSEGSPRPASAVSGSVGSLVQDTGGSYKAIVNATPGVTMMKFGGAGGGPGRQQTFVRATVERQGKTSAPLITVANTGGSSGHVSVHPRRRQSSIVGNQGSGVLVANETEGSKHSLTLNKRQCSSASSNGEMGLQAVSQLTTGRGSREVSMSKLSIEGPVKTEGEASGEEEVAEVEKKERPFSGGTTGSRASSNQIINVASPSGVASDGSGRLSTEVDKPPKKATPHRWDSAPSVHKGKGKVGKTELQKNTVACNEPKSPNVLRSCTVKEKKDEPLEILVYRDDKTPATDSSHPGYILRYADIDFSFDQLHLPKSAKPPVPSSPPRTSPPRVSTQTPPSRPASRKVDDDAEEARSESSGRGGGRVLTNQEMSLLQSIENLNKVLFSKLVKINHGEK
ncbi:hypothetical protein BC829DRAFT_181137 [Chytridium lagenaria]|nr:hypothetical protein BC829DRAFT_181137 [Chytridium lagenaria]